MKNLSVKKVVVWSLILAFIVGSILTGGPFNLIDLIVVRPIVNVLFIIFNLVHDFGLAIIIFTILVKVLMLPLTKRQLKQTENKVFKFLIKIVLVVKIITLIMLMNYIIVKKNIQIVHIGKLKIMKLNV